MHGWKHVKVEQKWHNTISIPLGLKYLMKLEQKQDPLNHMGKVLYNICNKKLSFLD
jgi:hypothetical protein